MLKKILNIYGRYSHNNIINMNTKIIQKLENTQQENSYD
jgi:hypothetical protein